MAEDDLLINIDLDTIDDGTDPVPDGQPPARIHSVIRKLKQGGEYPYFEIQMKPLEQPNKTLWLNLSMHPKALWNLKLFVKALGLPMKGLNLQDALGLTIAPTVKIVPSRNDPDRKINEVGPPYAAAR